MKKLIAMFLVIAALATSLTACSNGSADDPAETTTGQNSSSSTSNGDASGEGDAPLSLSLQEIADSIQSSDFEYPSLMEMPLEDAEFFKTNFGIDRPEGLKESLLIMPAISSIACSIGLLRMENADDARTVAQEIEGSLDTHQWICAQPSFVKAIARDDVVLLIVEGDDARGQAMVDAFNAL